jgi:integrase
MLNALTKVRFGAKRTVTNRCLPVARRFPTMKGKSSQDSSCERIRAKQPGHGAGTVGATVLAYFRAVAFHELAPNRKRARGKSLERFAIEHGGKRVSMLQRRHVQEMVEAMRETPGVARVFLSSLSVLMAFAIETGLRDDNPCVGIRRPRLSADGIKTWGEDDIAAFEVRHPVGSRARLAFALMLHTGQRRSDVIKFGRQHIRAGAIELRQQKTKTALAIPIHPELQTIIDASPADHLTFLVTEAGRPFTADGFGHWFGRRCKEAGLPGLSAHGLRKSISRRLAEAGCSASVIMAITGHKSLAEVERSGSHGRTYRGIY